MESFILQLLKPIIAFLESLTLDEQKKFAALLSIFVVSLTFLTSIFCKEKIESNRVTAGWENGDTFTAGKDRATLEGYQVVEVYVTDERARVWVTDWIARDGAADGCEDWREAHASVHAGVLGRVG